jgi:hypothetical protein
MIERLIEAASLIAALAFIGLLFALSAFWDQPPPLPATPERIPFGCLDPQCTTPLPSPTIPA